MPEALIGDALIQYVQSHPDTDRDRLIYETGYYEDKGEKIALRPTLFMEALLNAKNIALKPPSSRARSGVNKRAKGIIKVTKAGLAPVSSAYLRQVGIEPEAQCKVTVDKERNVVELAAAV